MKLELKHLAPYLPYGLKVSKIHTLSIGSSEGNGIGSINHVLKAVNEGKKQYKPILRPLSDLRKEEFNYLYTLLRVHLGKNKRDKLINEGYGITDLPYFIFKQLLEHHFDVFGLIDKGLAIDINTI